MLILYITYIDFGEAASGSGVRPQRMYRAMLEEGHQVKLLCGNQGDLKDHRARAAAVKEISRWLDSNRPDICYIESPVYPILWHFDRQLIRKIHRLGIPMGYFYRDYYRKFPDLYPRRTDPKGRMKEAFLDLLQERTDKVLRNVDIMYFSCAGGGELFDYSCVRLLPPAGEPDRGWSKGGNHVSIYVGGMGGLYGGKNMLKAFAILNSGTERYPLILVTREKEWAAIPDDLKGGDWLEVHHTSGDGLPPLYHRASLGLIPVEKTAYSDVAVNIKLFEYMSYGLPVACTNGKAVAELVEREQIGRVSADDPASMAENIRCMFSDAEAMARWAANARDAAENRHLWNHRVRQLTKELSALNTRG